MLVFLFAFYLVWRAFRHLLISPFRDNIRNILNWLMEHALKLEIYKIGFVFPSSVKVIRLWCRLSCICVCVHSSRNVENESKCMECSVDGTGSFSCVFPNGLVTNVYAFWDSLLLFLYSYILFLQIAKTLSICNS